MFVHFFTLILYDDKIAIAIVMIAIDVVIHFHLFVVCGFVIKSFLC